MSKPTDANEPSAASAGSRPVAWAVVLADGQRIYDVYGIEEEAKAIDEAVTGNHGIIPLYRSPTLTDEEREAVGRAAMLIDDTLIDDSDLALNDYQALRGLYERTK